VRLQQALAVVNPYAERLTFLDDKTRTRRDHMKYLSLIRAIALLHQYQRAVKTVEHQGRTVRYIEVEPGDIATANRLAHEVLGRTLDELPPQTRKLLTALHAWVGDECRRLAIKQVDWRFSRRHVRELTGWGDTQLRVHLERLVQMEYLLAHGGRRGVVFEYELVYDGQGAHGEAFLMGLQDMAGLGAMPSMPTTMPTSRGEEADLAGPSRPQRGVMAVASRPGPTGDEASADAPLREIGGHDMPNALPRADASARSYLQPSFLAASVEA
jgi:DNA primase